MTRTRSEQLAVAEAALVEAARAVGELDDDERRELAPLVFVDLLRLVDPGLVAVPIDAATAEDGR